MSTLPPNPGLDSSDQNIVPFLLFPDIFDTPNLRLYPFPRLVGCTKSQLVLMHAIPAPLGRLFYEKFSSFASSSATHH